MTQGSVVRFDGCHASLERDRCEYDLDARLWQLQNRWKQKTPLRFVFDFASGGDVFGGMQHCNRSDEAQETCIAFGKQGWRVAAATTAITKQQDNALLWLGVCASAGVERPEVFMD